MIEIPLKGLKGREGHDFVASPELIEAANVALALEMPLLLTGEPGCGKTDFAFALARWFAEQREGRELGDWRPEHPELGLLECYIRSDTEARDLLYRYDAVRRFADAQHGGDARVRSGDPRHYVELMPLGRALVSSERRVVLVDEIDKAPRDLPNDLLRELDQTQFEISELDGDLVTRIGEVKDPRGHPLERVMGKRKSESAADRRPKPLVIITSNEERQLPDPFLRRCAFFHIEFPKAEAIKEILARWYPAVDADTRVAAAKLFIALREAGLSKKPATAELLVWVRALFGGPVAAGRRAELRALAGRGDDKIEPRSVAWAEVPALCCLVKLREDLKLLRAETGAAKRAAAPGPA